MQIPPFNENLVPYLGFFATAGQIVLWAFTGRLEIGLLTFTGGLMAINKIDRIAGGGRKE